MSTGMCHFDQIPYCQQMDEETQCKNLFMIHFFMSATAFSAYHYIPATYTILVELFKCSLTDKYTLHESLLIALSLQEIPSKVLDVSLS